jgi:hypothetical protein
MPLAPQMVNPVSTPASCETYAEVAHEATSAVGQAARVDCWRTRVPGLENRPRSRTPYLAGNAKKVGFALTQALRRCATRPDGIAEADRDFIALSRKATGRRRLRVLALIGGVFMLIIMTTWVSHRATTDAVVALMRERADVAAQRIGQQFDEIERQMAWTTRAVANLNQRRADYALLLQEVPAIDEIMQIGGNGHVQLRVARVSTEATPDTDLSKDPRFTQALAKRLWIGPIYFRDQVDPYVTIAIAHSGLSAAVTTAEIDLRFLRDVISGVHVGATGYAYVVGPQGQLLAQPERLKVPRGTPPLSEAFNPVYALLTQYGYWPRPGVMN